VIVKQILAKEGKREKESEQEKEKEREGEREREREKEREKRLPTVPADKNLGQPDHFSRRLL